MYHSEDGIIAQSDTFEDRIGRITVPSIGYELCDPLENRAFAQVRSLQGAIDYV